MSKSRSVRLVVGAAAAVVLAGAAATGSGARIAPSAEPRIAPTHASAASARRDWFWSKHAARRTLLLNGISWTRVRQHWTVTQALCSGLGHWIIRRGVPRFRNFYCHVRAFPRGQHHPHRVNYNIIFHVKGRFAYRLSFAGSWGPGTWGWTPQYAADALVNGDLQFVGGAEDVLESSCSPFGQSWVSNGYRYYKLFYCAVRTAQSRPYAVATRVVDQNAAVSIFVSYLDEIPFTPAVPQPTPSSNTSNEHLWEYFQNATIGLPLIQNGIKLYNRQHYGSNYAPTAADILSGAVGCPDHPFNLAPFQSHGFC